MYDVLATLRRSGEPYELHAGDLMRQSMVTTGAITNRIDRLEQRGLVERAASSDRRKVIVRLTKKGFDTVENVVDAHMATRTGDPRPDCRNESVTTSPGCCGPRCSTWATTSPIQSLTSSQRVGTLIRGVAAARTGYPQPHVRCCTSAEPARSSFGLDCAGRSILADPANRRGWNGRGVGGDGLGPRP